MTPGESTVEVPTFPHIGSGEESFDPGLIEDYLEETRDRVHRAEELVMVFDSGRGTDEDLRSLFRALHTIKGDSASLGLSEIVALVHAAESYVQEFSAGGRPLTTMSADALLEVVDALNALCGNLRTRSLFVQGKLGSPGYAPVALSALMTKLKALAGM